MFAYRALEGNTTTIERERERGGDVMIDRRCLESEGRAGPYPNWRSYAFRPVHIGKGCDLQTGLTIVIEYTRFTRTTVQYTLGWISTNETV